MNDEQLINEIDAPVVKRGKKPSSFTVEGGGMSDIIAQYVAADDAIKAAEDRKKEIRGLLTPVILEGLFAEAKDATEPSVSVDVSDASGAVVQFQLQASYGKLDQEGAKMLAEILQAADLELNDVIQREGTIIFDISAFSKGGKVDEDTFSKFETAAAGICKELGVESPILRGVTHSIKKEFHTNRLKVLSVEENLFLQEKMPAKEVLKVKRDKKSPAKGWQWLKGKLMG